MLNKVIAKPPKRSFDIHKLLTANKKVSNAKRDSRNSEKFPCDYCDRVFDKTQSLGGHISKKHPGKSEHYAIKQQKRAENEHDREMRRRAKEYFRLKTKKDPAAYRQKITEIKKIFIALDSQPSNEEQTNLTDMLDRILSNVVAQRSRY